MGDVTAVVVKHKKEKKEKKSKNSELASALVGKGDSHISDPKEEAGAEQGKKLHKEKKEKKRKHTDDETLGSTKAVSDDGKKGSEDAAVVGEGKDKKSKKSKKSSTAQAVQDTAKSNTQAAVDSDKMWTFKETVKVPESTITRYADPGPALAVWKAMGIKSVCIYGGMPKWEQRNALKQGMHVIVATPGRLIDLFEEDSTICDLSQVTYLVLDEADRMLDIGFEEAIKKIVARLPTSAQGRQTVMFSATWPQTIQRMAMMYLNDPVKVTVGSTDLSANISIEQRVEVLDPMAKKLEASRLEQLVRRNGYNVAAIHGDLSQIQRTAAIDGFRSGKCPLLIATDVAARGIDILMLSGLINILKQAKQPVPPELLKFGTTTKRKVDPNYGVFAKDVDMTKKGTKITFAASDDEDEYILTMSTSSNLYTDSYSGGSAYVQSSMSSVAAHTHTSRSGRWAAETVTKPRGATKGTLDRYFTPDEVMLHDSSDDCWVSFLGLVYDLTRLVTENQGSPLLLPILKNAGKDISHWFDRISGDIKTHVHPLTNRVVPFTPEGRFVHVPSPISPEDGTCADECVPWWLDKESYCIGNLSQKTRHIRIINTLTKDEHVIKVSTIVEYFSLNAHVKGYMWKRLGVLLDMNLTLEENGVRDESDYFDRLGIDEDQWLPALHLYFSDDLTVA
ncbi:hypothetical protein BSLG_003435 [Batrachochytrium salamandrivorans]|nr:hypothetical protein BSLG_003435 [Batrachochytrium salamandrivorans]